MTVSLAASTATPALLPSGGQGGIEASQSLFEHMANTAKGTANGASPHQIGNSLMERLNDFIDRTRSFSQRTEALTQGAASSSNATAPSIEKTTAAPGDTPKVAGEKQVDQLVQSMGKMFDYSIETQMVVRGATQISGAANTLLKGQ